MRIRHVAGQELSEIIHEKLPFVSEFSVKLKKMAAAVLMSSKFWLQDGDVSVTRGFDNLITTKVLLLIFLRKRDYFGNFVKSN